MEILRTRELTLGNREVMIVFNMIILPMIILRAFQHITGMDLWGTIMMTKTSTALVMMIGILCNTRLSILRVTLIPIIEDRDGRVLVIIPLEDLNIITKVPPITLAHPLLLLFFPRPHRETRGEENQERDQRGKEEPIVKGEG